MVELTWDCDECYSQKQLCESCAVEKKKLLPKCIECNSVRTYQKICHECRNRMIECEKCGGTGVVKE